MATIPKSQAEADSEAIALAYRHNPTVRRGKDAALSDVQIIAALCRDIDRLHEEIGSLKAIAPIVVQVGDTLARWNCPDWMVLNYQESAEGAGLAVNQD